MTTGEFSWTTEDGLSIYAKEWPVQWPKAVLCIVHGLGEHLGRYEHVAAYFNSRNIAVLSSDQRGHGRSEGRRGHTPDYEALLKAIDQLLKEAKSRYPNLPVFLFGHSLGGNLVLKYTLARTPKLAGLLVSAPLILPGFPPPKILLAFATFIRSIYPAFSQSSGLKVEHLSRDKAVVEAYKNDPLVHGTITAALAVDMLAVGKELDTFSGRLSVPTLLMHGSEDKITSPEASRRFAERTQRDVLFKEWPGLFHELHNEPEQQDVLNYMWNWMQEKTELFV